MRIRMTKARAAAAALCGTAAIATAACSAPAPATAMAMRAPAGAGATATATPVIVRCGALGQRHPAEYVLTCAGTGAQLIGLQWVSWGPSSAFAAGSEVVNDCVPSCAGGTGHAFPALVALWRAEPRPGHPGKRYFTRMTIIYTGSHSYAAGGKLVTLPATVTYPLSSSGGA
jgi:hypothetical protein